MLKQLIHWGRYRARLLQGREVFRRVDVRVPVEVHGNPGGAFAIRRDSLRSSSIVYSVGIGEEISFDRSIVQKYGCTIFGFDPTPRAVAYVRQQNPPSFKFTAVGLGATTGKATLHLPRNEAFVSGSILEANHLTSSGIEVEMMSLGDLMAKFGHAQIDALKMDIEGAEYAVIERLASEGLLTRVSQILIEFHHRFPAVGPQKTEQAIRTLAAAGFQRAWISASGEEYLFTR